MKSALHAVLLLERLLPCLVLGNLLAKGTSCSEDTLDAVDAGVGSRDRVAMPDPDRGSSDSPDTGVPDTGAPDIGPPDVGSVDAGSPAMNVSGCGFAGYEPTPLIPPRAPQPSALSTSPRSMHISHESIYRSLFVQARGVLRRELLAYLRTKRCFRGRRKAQPAHQGQIIDARS